MIVLGTAGHIDHGKTTLVRALTGIDTDRLPVEKERGITTELGFAHLALSDGRVASVVDAPGHERFVRHMIAGAGGLDLAVLVVAADEGVMPQTREHLDILGLVGVRRGLVVLSKADLVDADGLELAREDVAAALAGTPLAGAPVLPFAATRPEELPAFRQAFDAAVRALLPEVPDRPVDRPFRMAVDRVFVSTGFGAVATGTVTSGELSVGDEVEVLPAGRRARVRSLQHHGDDVPRVLPGMRAAINVQGLGTGDLQRGDVLSVPGGLRTGAVLDVSVTLLARVHRAQKRRSSVTAHLGTRMMEGHLVLLEGESLAPGATALAQLRLSEPAAALAGERFVLRGFETLEGYGRTVGGGVVLRPASSPRRSTDAAGLAWLRDLRDGDATARARAAVELCGAEGVTADDLLATGPLGRRDLNRALSRLVAAGDVAPFPCEGRTRYLGAATRARLGAALREALDAAHRRAPDRAFATAEELRGALPLRPPVEALDLVLRAEAAAGALVAEGAGWRLPLHQTRGALLGPQLEQVQAALRQAGVQGPTAEDLAPRAALPLDTVRAALNELCRTGAAVRLEGTLHFDAGVLADVQARLESFLDRQGRIGMGEWKDLLQATRRAAVPLAEWFDSRHVTLRLPDGQRKRYGR